MKVRDMVLVPENSPTLKWKMAVVDKLSVGDDGLVCAANTFKRVVVRLIGQSQN